MEGLRTQKFKRDSEHWNNDILIIVEEAKNYIHVKQNRNQDRHTFKYIEISLSIHIIILSKHCRQYHYRRSKHVAQVYNVKYTTSSKQIALIALQQYNFLPVNFFFFSDQQGNMPFFSPWSILLFLLYIRTAFWNRATRIKF